jgi:hypothetical protein
MSDSVVFVFDRLCDIHCRIRHPNYFIHVYFFSLLAAIFRGVSPTTYGGSNVGHVRHGTHLSFFCVEIADGISGSESDDSVADNPTAAQSVRFHNDSASQEIFELQRLEDMGFCLPIDDS